MTDRNAIIRAIEDRLGRDGTPEMAEAMLKKLAARGGVSWTASDGYEFMGEDPETGTFPAFDAALLEVVAGEQ